MSHPNQLHHVRDQVRDQGTEFFDGAILDFEEALVFGEIPLLVSDIQYSPALRRPAQGMGEAQRFSLR